MKTEWNIKIFTDNFEKYMKLSGKNQKEIADALGVSAPTVHDWLKGNKMPKMTNVKKLADLFNVKLSDLVEEKMTAEKSKKNDALADIVVRLKTNNEFLSVVETIAQLNDDDLEKVKKMLVALF